MSKISEAKKAYEELKLAQKNMDAKEVIVYIEDSGKGNPFLRHTGEITYNVESDTIKICSDLSGSNIIFHVETIPSIIKALQSLLEEEEKDEA